MSHPKDTNDLFPAVRFHLRLPEPPQTATPSRGTEPSVQEHTGTSHIQAIAPTSLEAACREHVTVLLLSWGRIPVSVSVDHPSFLFSSTMPWKGFVQLFASFR